MCGRNCVSIQWQGHGSNPTVWLQITDPHGKQRGPREGGAGIWADSQREPELGQYPRRWRETDEVEIFRGKISRTGG